MLFFALKSFAFARFRLCVPAKFRTPVPSSFIRILSTFVMRSSFEKQHFHANETRETTKSTERIAHYIYLPRTSPSLFNAFADVSLKKARREYTLSFTEKFIYSYGFVVCVVKGK